MLPIPKNVMKKHTLSSLWIIVLRGVLVLGIIAIVAYISVPLRVGAADSGCVDGKCTYTNPIGGQNDSFTKLLDTVATAIIRVGTPLAAAAIIIIGIRFVIAAASGDQAGISKARTMLWYVLIGTAIIVGSSVIAKAVINLFEKGTTS